MRKLKLQMHLSVDNYVNMESAGNDFKWDDEVIKFCVQNLEDVDTLLLGRKTAEELIPFWDNVASDPSHKDYALGKRISGLSKLVFSNSSMNHGLKNTNIISGNLLDKVVEQKRRAGKNMLVYGGASFVRSLVEANLIDEFFFLINPFCLGQGKTIFKNKAELQTLTFLQCRRFDCGTVMLGYKVNS
jgi:dihydrofolate reductase